MSGKVDPSGKTVDEWTRDFTNDPTYANVIATEYTDESGTAIKDEDSANGDNYNGIDYEEDIYLGYKFYETYWKEGGKGTNLKSVAADADTWYAENVVYPFGYGLSYTEFSYELEGITANNGAELSAAMTSNNLSSSVGSPATVTSLTAKVKVTNKGEVSGKETVEIYVEAPYDSTTAPVEKPYLTLVGYGKTDELKAGESETLEITFNVQDFASYDYADVNNNSHTGYELEAGSYSIHVMESSAHTNIVASEATDGGDTAHENAYEVATFTLDATAKLDLDDWSGNKIENLFSTTDTNDSQSDYYSMSTSSASGTMYSPLDKSQTSTLLSRSNFDNTMPKAPTNSAIDDDVVASIKKFNFIDADDGTWSDEGAIWEKDVTDLEGWTQGKGEAGSDGLYATTLDDMSGVALYDADGNVTEAWVDFMNLLTWDEIMTVLNDGYHLTTAVPSIGKVQTDDENGPNHIYSGPDLVGAPTRSATWNTELMYKSGIVCGDVALSQELTGYYGPGINMHRSPFGGRVAEYFSQDSIQGGYIAAAFCQGMTNRGINVYIKHFALYDSNGASDASSCSVCASEQNMRENYLKIFQMCMQEGGAHACMTSLNRIGSVFAGQNYALQQQLAKEEWGWTGYFVTDTRMMLPYMSADGLIRTGGNIPDGNFSMGDTAPGDPTLCVSGDFKEKKDYDWSTEIEAAVEAGKIIPSENFAAPEGAVMLGKNASPTQWYWARTAAMQLLYNQANSAGNMNGLTSGDITNTSRLSVQQAVSATTDVNGVISGIKFVSDNIDLDRVMSSVVTGGDGMPDGMYVENGQLFGTPTESGSTRVTVVSYIDGWIEVTSTVIITVAASISLDAADTGVDISNLVTGESINNGYGVYIDYDGTVFDAQTVSITFAISDGALPTGLELSSDGLINGVATEAGTYSFTIAMSVADPNAYHFEWDAGAEAGYNEALNYGLMEYAGVSTDSELIVWLLAGNDWNGYDMLYYFIDYIVADDPDIYYLTYKITVTGDSIDVGDGGSESGSSSGNGLAIAALVLAIVAIVAAAVVAVLVVLKRNNKGSGDKGSDSGDETATE